MRVSGARNSFLDLPIKFSFSLSEILKNLVRLHWACEGNCRYAEECAKEFGATHTTYFNTAVRDKLSDITGVYCGMLINRFEAEENVAAHEHPHWKP